MRDEDDREMTDEEAQDWVRRTTYVLEGECETPGCEGRRFWQRIWFRDPPKEERAHTVHCPWCGREGSLTWIRRNEEVGLDPEERPASDPDP